MKLNSLSVRVSVCVRACVMAAISLNLPPGFRFSPTEVELIDYYLRSKITGINEEVLSFIREVQFFKREPWDLPGLSGLKTTDLEWCFFSPQDLKNPNGKRLNRKTNDGYWKVTGKDQEIWSGESLIGIKKILVFYETSSGNCKKTDWVMHEYHTTLKELDGTNPGQKTYVLCRLFDKQKQNSGKAGPAKSKLALASESPALEDHPTTNESLHSENSDGIMKYDTIATSESPDNGSNGRKRKYSGKAGPAKSKRSAVSVSPALEKQAEDHTTTNECLRSQNSDTIASVDCSDSYSNAYAADNLVEEMTQVIADEVDQQLETNPLTPITSLSNAATDSSPNIAKSSPEEAKSDLTQASSSVSPALVQAEDYPRIDGNTSDTRAPVECGDNTFNAYAAQNLVSDTEFDLQVQQYIKDLSDWMQNPLDCNPSTPITSLWDTTKSSPEEAESDLTQASVSPAPGGEADNHVTRCNPSKTFDVTKSNTIAFTECNHFSDNADTTKNQVAEVVDSNMSCVPPLELLKYYSILRSPLHSQMQYELVPHCNSDSLTNDVVTSQYGTNEAATYNSLWGLMPNSPYKFPHNDPRSHYDSKLFPIGSRL